MTVDEALAAFAEARPPGVSQGAVPAQAAAPAGSTRPQLARHLPHQAASEPAEPCGCSVAVQPARAHALSSAWQLDLGDPPPPGPAGVKHEKFRDELRQRYGTGRGGCCSASSSLPGSSPDRGGRLADDAAAPAGSSGGGTPAAQQLRRPLGFHIDGATASSEAASTSRSGASPDVASLRLLGDLGGGSHAASSVDADDGENSSIGCSPNLASDFEQLALVRGLKGEGLGGSDSAGSWQGGRAGASPSASSSGSPVPPLAPHPSPAWAPGQQQQQQRRGGPSPLRPQLRPLSGQQAADVQQQLESALLGLSTPGAACRSSDGGGGLDEDGRVGRSTSGGGINNESFGKVTGSALLAELR